MLGSTATTMNPATTPSRICRSVTAALAFAALLLTIGCSTTASVSRSDPARSSAYFENYGELHGIMTKLVAESDQRIAPQPATVAAGIASSLASGAALASNP